MAAKKTSGETNRTQRRGGTRSIARILPALTKPALRKRNAAEASLHLDWQEIVGPEIAQRCRPRKMTFPKLGERRDGFLHLLVDPVYALDLQHLQPLLIERINQHFGFGLVANLKLMQQPLEQSPSRPSRVAPAAVDPKRREDLEKRADAIEDPLLRQALLRLGTSLARGKRSK